MKTKSFITGCISTLLLANVFFACTPVQGLDPKHNKDNSLEAVQIYFRDGLLDADMVKEAEERLAKSIPYKVIPPSETTDNKLVLKIIVDSIEKNQAEEWGYGKIWLYSALQYSKFVPPSTGLIGVALFPVVATLATKEINNLKEKFGSLPFYFNTFVTASGEEILFDDNMSDKYQQLLNKRIYNHDRNYIKIENSVVNNAMQSEYKNTDVYKVSLDIWLESLTYYLNRYHEVEQETSDS